MGRSHFDDVKWDMASDSLPDLDIIDQIDRVIHIAGKAHSVPRNTKEEQLFFTVNYHGTIKLLHGIDNWVLKNNSMYPRQFIFISSVSVYGLDAGENISEDYPCQPQTPYGKSKLQAEESVLEWGRQHGIAILILRLPLIWGEEAPGNLGAMEKAIRKGYYFRIGSGEAVRSMVDIHELAVFMANLKGDEQGIYNMVSCNVSYNEIEQYFGKKYNRRIKVIPRGFAKFLAKIGDRVSTFPLDSYRLNKMENLLTFDSSLAIEKIGWIGTELKI